MNRGRKYFFLLIRSLLGAVMTVAGIAKLLDPRSFATAIRQMDILPPSAIFPFMVVIVQCEIWLGIALLFGFRTRIAARLLAGLVSLFIIAIVVSLLRGNAGDCGCFGTFGSEKLGPGLIVRDVLILILCLWVSFQAASASSRLQKSEQEKTIDYS